MPAGGGFGGSNIKRSSSMTSIKISYGKPTAISGSKQTLSSLPLPSHNNYNCPSSSSSIYSSKSKLTVNIAGKRASLVEIKALLDKQTSMVRSLREPTVVARKNQNDQQTLGFRMIREELLLVNHILREIEQHQFKQLKSNCCGDGV